MADILIRMEMPKTCADCHDADLPTAIAWLGAKCPWAHGIIDPGVYDLRHERHPDCPLVELPEHGDLIDRDAFDADARKRYCSACDNYNGTKCRACWVDDMLGDVADFEVVIPSNKEGTE